MASSYEMVPTAELVGAAETDEGAPPAAAVVSALAAAPSDPTPDAPSSRARTTADVKKAKKQGTAGFCHRFQIAYARTLRDFLRNPFVNKVFDAGMRVFSFVAKYVVGPALVCVALGLIGFVTHTFFMHVVPLKRKLGSSSTEVTIRACIGIFLVSNGLYNYIMTIFTDPGYPPEYEQALADCQEGGARPRQCSKCTKSKPERCHHCSVCRRCVLKMDHHCPWVNTCVGHGNYRHFLLFMLYIFSCCVFIIANLLPHFMEMMTHRRQSRHSTVDGREAIMTSFMISASISLSLTILGSFHAFLLVSNQTTIEFQDNFPHLTYHAWRGVYYRNPYDINTSHNFQSVFGPNAFCGLRWFMPYFAAKPTGNGLEWPTRRLLESDSEVSD